MDRLAQIGRAVRTDTGCLWAGKPNQRGNLKGTRVYIIAFEITNGPVPTGKLVCHSCDTPGCFEPTHLYAGTQANNMHDAVERERLGGSVTWTREQRLAAGLDGSKARAASVAARNAIPRCSFISNRRAACSRRVGHPGRHHA